jgi:hypothetical protein
MHECPPQNKIVVKFPVIAICKKMKTKNIAKVMLWVLCKNINKKKREKKQYKKKMLMSTLLVHEKIKLLCVLIVFNFCIHYWHGSLM